MTTVEYVYRRGHLSPTAKSCDWRQQGHPAVKMQSKTPISHLGVIDSTFPTNPGEHGDDDDDDDDDDVIIVTE